MSKKTIVKGIIKATSKGAKSDEVADDALEQAGKSQNTPVSEAVVDENLPEMLKRQSGDGRTDAEMGLDKPLEEGELPEMLKRQAGDGSEMDDLAGGGGSGGGTGDLPPAGGGGDVPPVEPAMFKTGTTAQTPNIDYYNNKETKQLLDIIQSGATKAEPIKHADIKKAGRSKQAFTEATGLKPSLNWNPEQLFSLRTVLESQSRDVQALSKSIMEIKTAGGEPPSEMLAQLNQAMTQMAATHNTVTGLSTQAAQLLNSHTTRAWRTLSKTVVARIT